MTNINQLRDEIHDTAKAKGWWDDPREFGTLIALCHSELSEALEEARADSPVEETLYEHKYNPAAYPMVLSDFAVSTVSLPGGYIEDIRSPRVEGLDPEDCAMEGEVLDGATEQEHGVADQRTMPFVRSTSIGKPVGVPSELADVIIRILDMCGYYDINIEEIILEKMAYNETRSHKHGGKSF